MIAKNTGLVQVCKLYYQLLENVESITENIDKTVTVILVDEEEWEEVYFSPGSLSLVIAQKNDNVAGIYYNHKLTAKHPGEDTSVDEWDEIVRHELIFKVVYNNGVEKILGKADNPVIIDNSLSTITFTFREFGFEWDNSEAAKVVSI
jgi:hypothetical protein